MKEVKMFMFEGCPHCKKAQELIEALKEKCNEYAQIKILSKKKKKDPQIADAYDYYYVPAFFVDEVKVHEGVPSEEKIRIVLDKAL